MKSIINGKAVTGVAILILIIASLCIGCTSQKEVPKPGDTVKVDYSAALATTGEVFESSYNSTPIQFVVGTQPEQVIKGFDEAVMNMSPGETRTNIFIPVDKAYGPRNMSLIYLVPKTGALLNYTPTPGQLTYVTMKLPGGQTVRYPIIASNQTTVTIDANNPLAGQDLLFNITLIEIVKK